MFSSADETPQLTLPTIPPPRASTELPKGNDQKLYKVSQREALYLVILLFLQTTKERKKIGVISW